MPATVLLDIDPDKLFERHTIQEIEETQKKLQYEIERKREELRTMVGERYRDLIEAADTISEMKVLSQSVIKDVEKMKVATLQLQQKQITGFNLDSAHARSVNQAQKCRVAAQIKLLVDVAEYIWMAVDCRDFTLATLLFLLARHVKTSLEMDQDLKTASSFPVIARQWASMVHFKETILTGSEAELQAQYLSSKDALGSLISIILLQGYDSSQLLNKFFVLRSEALQRLLSFDQHLPDSSSVKQRLYESHALIINSLLALCHCFIESPDAGEGLLWKQLHSIMDSEACTTLELIQLRDFDVSFNFLPPVVKDFRPHTSKELKPVSTQEMEAAVSKWLIWVQKFVSDKGGSLLNLLSSLRSLQGLRDTVQILPDEWPLVTQKLLLKKPLNLWMELYRPLITSRAKQLVVVHWDSAISVVEQEIRKSLDSSLLEDKQSEVDLRWYIWKESTTDLGAKSNFSKLQNSKGLWLKSKGISPRVSDLCGILESKLTTLVTDLATLCSDREVDPAVLSDTQTLKQHQQTVCAEAITRLVNFVRKELNEREHNESTVITLARFLQAMPELCPSLHKCVSASESKTISWQEICTTLHSEVLGVYKVWLDLVKTRLEPIIKDRLRQPAKLTDLFKSTPQWELVNIEEGGESGEVLKSELRVPSSPSFSLQSVLNEIAALVGRAAVPKQVTEQLVDSLVLDMISCYRPDLEVTITQSQYLQHLLDVKYMSHILIGPHKKSLQAQVQVVIAEIEGKVDPFDLNVFAPYINDNVKRSVQRTQCLLGVICASHNVSTVLNMSSKNEEPSVLAMSSSAASTWFPLLHITAPHTGRTIHPPNKPKGIKKSTSTPSLELNNEIPRQSAASSFFGVMATDWFG